MSERKLTMERTILIIGSVTSKQYQSLRLTLLKDGYKPKIVRVDEEKFLAEQYLPDVDSEDDSEYSIYYGYLMQTYEELVGKCNNPHVILVDQTICSRWKARNTYREMVEMLDEDGIDVVVVWGLSMRCELLSVLFFNRTSCVHLVAPLLYSVLTFKYLYKVQDCITEETVLEYYLSAIQSLIN